MITVISIFAIISVLVASELFLVYKNYRESVKLKAIRNDYRNLNYSSR